MDAKTKAIVSHLFVIGWIIALIVNSNKKEELASYYIRQNLGFIIVWLGLTILRVIPLIGPVIWAVGHTSFRRLAYVTHLVDTG